MAIRIHLPEYNKSEDVLNLFETPKVPVGCQRAHGKRPPEKLTSRGRSIRTTEKAPRSPVADVEKITSSMPIGSDQPPPEEERRSAKRKASFIDDDHTNDRTIRAKFCKPKPEYQIQQSTKYPGQQIALDWLSENGKRYHDWVFEVLIGRWGRVKPIHRGTCVLCPDKWRLKTPSCLAPIRDPSLLPGPGAVPLVFSYSDYTTSFSRAAAWFRGGQWPRSGKEHDAFLGAHKLEAMEASHTCHQEHCIVHLTYEQLDESLDRERCALWARSLRHAGHSIPEKCHCHSPPCLLQHAALTTAETYLIQFDVLHQATGFVLNIMHKRPEGHQFPTFESCLPLTWGTSSSLVAVDNANLLADAPILAVERPNQLCRWCPKLKSFTTLLGFWEHVANKHVLVDKTILLEEIRRSASLWRPYVFQNAKETDSLRAKLVTVESDTFCWTDVEAWQLRCRRYHPRWRADATRSNSIEQS